LPGDGNRFFNPRFPFNAVLYRIYLFLRERLERLSARRKARPLADELDRIAKRCSTLPLLDSRSADQILGYDKHGLLR
jgi:antitoxin VapB